MANHMWLTVQILAEAIIRVNRILRWYYIDRARHCWFGMPKYTVTNVHQIHNTLPSTCHSPFLTVTWTCLLQSLIDFCREPFFLLIAAKRPDTPQTADNADYGQIVPGALGVKEMDLWSTAQSGSFSELAMRVHLGVTTIFLVSGVGFFFLLDDIHSRLRADRINMDRYIYIYIYVHCWQTRGWIEVCPERIDTCDRKVTGITKVCCVTRSMIRGKWSHEGVGQLFLGVCVCVCDMV